MVSFFEVFGGTLCLLLGESAVIFKIRPFLIWVTPLCWTGYILLIDGYLYQKKGNSFLLSRPLKALFSFPLSAGVWAIFEGYNLLLKNWEYLYVPSNPFVAYTGYLWSFGTILPALFETDDLLKQWGWCQSLRIRAAQVPEKGLLFSFFLGLLFLIYPLLTASPYDFPPVWLGFIFLLEPLNYRFGEGSLLRCLEKGEVQPLLTLLTAGGIMGFLWEFWNFWAGAKWVYHIPALSFLKIFEMPLVGFLGFFPFAIECYVIYHFVSFFLGKLRRSGGPGT